MSATTTTTTISNGSKKIEVLITSSSTANRLNETSSRDYSNPATLTNSSEVKSGTTLTNSSRIVISTPPSPIQSPLSPTRPEFYSSNDDDDDDDENDEEENRIIEESLNGRWSKLLCEISTQKLADFDTAHLAIDSERGCEVAWNEMLFNKQPNTLTTSMSSSQKQHRNRFVSAEALRTIYEKLENILKLLVKLEHSNLLRVYDYWFVDNAHVAKLVVITEYSSAGCLRRILDAAMIKSSGGGSRSIGANVRGRIKYQTGRRWLNQTLYLLRCLHHDGISLFQGTFTAETIFIQSCGVIKLAPVLLALNGLCVCENGVYKPTGASAPRIELKDENRLKDKQALGRLAIQIFTAHIKPASSPGGSGSSRSSNRMDPNIAINIDDYLALIDEPLQRDFVRACFEPSNSVESIWLHPFLNCIYSLKVLSVYSIFAYFQEKRQQLDLATNSPPNNNLLNSTGRKNSFSSQSSSSSLAKLRKNSSKFSQIFAAADSTAGKIAQIRSHFERIYTVSEYNDDNEEENDDVEVELSSSLGSLRRAKKDLKDLPPRPPPPNNGVQQKIIIHEGDAPPAAQNHAPTPLGLSSSQNNASYSNLMTKFSKNRELSRKVSLTFLTNVHDLKIPQDFFSILEDIRSGLYPRLFKDWDSSAESASKSIPSTQYIDFMIQHKQLMVDRRRASLSSQHELSDIVGQSSLLSGRNSSNSVCEANMGSRAMSRASSRMSSRNGLSSAAGSSPRLLSKMHSIDTGDVELSSMRERLQQPQEEVHDMLLNHHHHHHHYHHPPLPVSQLAMETANINSGANVAFSPPTLKNYPVEMRRIVKNECLIRKGSSPSRSKLTTAKVAGGIEIGESSTTLTPQQTPSSSPHYTASQPVAINKPSTTMNSMVELALSLEFDDSTRRSIYSHFPVEFLDKLKLEHAKSSYELDRCAMTAGLEYLDYVMYESPFEDKLRKVAEHLSHELVDNGLISPKDFVLIADLFYKTIEESIANDAAASADASSAPLLHFYLSPSTSRDCLLNDIFI